MTDDIEAENVSFRRAAGLVNQAALLALFAHCDKQPEVLATFRALGAQAEAQAAQSNDDAKDVEMLRKVFAGMVGGFERVKRG